MLYHHKYFKLHSGAHLTGILTKGNHEHSNGLEPFTIWQLIVSWYTPFIHMWYVFSSKLNYKLLKLDDNCILVTQYRKHSCCLVDAIHQCPKYYLQPKISMGQSKSYSRMGSKTMYCSRCLLNCLLDHSNNHLEFILKGNYYHLCCWLRLVGM